MAIHGIFYIALHVSNLAASKQFYAETLGWRLETEEPGVAGLWVGDGYVVLLANAPDSPGPRPGGMHVAVQVEDIAQEHARLREHGVAVSELVSQPWGERNFRFTDPDGYQWAYGEIASASR